MHMSNIFKKIGLGLAALLVLCAAFFFLYVVKTPHYSLYQIHKAVQTHDTVLLSVMLIWIPYTAKDSMI